MLMLKGTVWKNGGESCLIETLPEVSTLASAFKEAHETAKRLCREGNWFKIWIVGVLDLGPDPECESGYGRLKEDVVLWEAYPFNNDAVGIGYLHESKLNLTRYKLPEEHYHGPGGAYLVRLE